MGSKEGLKTTPSISGMLPAPAPSTGGTMNALSLPASSATSMKPFISGVPHLEGLTACYQNVHLFFIFFSLYIFGASFNVLFNYPGEH